jgi:protein-S-isoprenylcysteine O-methyltransferase Ste14
MFTIRIYYQRKIRSEQLFTEERGSRLRLIPGAIAAFVTIVFSLEYIFAPGTFEFAYILEFPTWLRWVGVLMLIIGISLLWAAHHHLGKSFHSLVVLKEDQVLVESGPYKWIRHPIYMWAAHHHLGKSFHSLVVLKEDQVLVESGPYKWIRHPIYTAYFLNYIGGGLLAGNWVLTFVPVFFFGLMVYLRIGEEEAVLIEKFGDEYRAYMKKTGRFLPLPSK